MRENSWFWIAKYRQEIYTIFYQDETWMNENIANNKIWRFGDGSVEYKVPSRIGEHRIVAHVRSVVTGLLDGCLLMMCGRKNNNNADYHTEMNGSVFCDWLKDEVFRAMKL